MDEVAFEIETIKRDSYVMIVEEVQQKKNCVRSKAKEDPKDLAKCLILSIITLMSKLVRHLILTKLSKRINRCSMEIRLLK